MSNAACGILKFVHFSIIPRVNRQSKQFPYCKFPSSEYIPLHRWNSHMPLTRQVSSLTLASDLVSLRVSPSVNRSTDFVVPFLSDRSETEPVFTMRQRILGFAAGLLVTCNNGVHAFWRMNCDVIQTARIDPIVNPGALAAHCHTIVGASSQYLIYPNIVSEAEHHRYRRQLDLRHSHQLVLQLLRDHPRQVCVLDSKSVLPAW